jgi:hypothetical protein
METTQKERKLKNIDYKVANKICNQLLKDLRKADDKFMLNYIVEQMDVMIGIVRKKYEKKN